MDPFGRSLSNDLPRPMSLLARLRVLFANGWVQGGLAVLCFGSFLFWAFRPDESLVELFRGPRLETAEGVVMACKSETVGQGSGDNYTGLYPVSYRFKTPDGTEHRRRCYKKAHERPDIVNQAVVVEYAKDSPSNSCIRGMQPTIVGHYGLFFLLPVVGPAVMVLAGLMTGYKSIRLLRQGLAASGTLIACQKTIVSVGGSKGHSGAPVYKLTFEFTASDGMAYQTTVRTHRLGGPSLGHEQPILYDPVNPNCSGVLYAFVGWPRIDEDGVVRVRQAFLALPALILPIVVVAGNLRGLLHSLSR